MFYDLETNTNSSSNELKSHMEDFILIIIILLKSDKGFGSTLVGYIYKIWSILYLLFTYNISHCESNMYPSYYPLG